MRSTLAFSLVFKILKKIHYFNNDQLSLEAKWKLKLNLLQGHPEDVTRHQQH